MEIILEMKNVQISFPYGQQKIQVVRGLDLTVGRGEILGILGETGSGKSVSSAAILGLIRDEDGSIDEGSIFYDGKDISQYQERELRKLRGKDISCIFQNPVEALNPYLTVGTQIMEMLKIHGEGGHKETVLKSLVEVGLDNASTIYHMYPFQLSGGQCQRVMIAMAVICKPRLLIADEPTSSIDASLRSKILSLLAEINTRYGTAIIVITHDFGVVRSICHRIIVMYGGLMMEEGRTEEVLSNALHPYTRQLIRCANSFTDKTKRLYSLAGSAPSPLDYGEECPFYTRCSQKKDACRQAVPAMQEIFPGRKVRCLRL